MNLQTIKGYMYAATAGEESAEVTDANGLTLSIGAGEQVLFTATTDEIVVASGTITLTQVR